MTELHVVHAILKTVVKSADENKMAENEDGEISMTSTEDGKTEVLNLKISKTSDPDKFDGILSCLERLIGPLRQPADTTFHRPTFGASFGRGMASNVESTSTEKTGSCCSCSHHQHDQAAPPEPKKTETDIDERDTKWTPSPAPQQAPATRPAIPLGPPIPVHHHCSCQHLPPFSPNQLPPITLCPPRPALPAIPPPGTVPLNQPPPIIIAPRPPPPPMGPLPMPPIMSDKSVIPMFDVHRPPPPLPGRLQIMPSQVGPGGDGPRMDFTPHGGSQGDGDSRMDYGQNYGQDGTRFDGPQYDGPVYGQSGDSRYGARSSSHDTSAHSYGGNQNYDPNTWRRGYQADDGTWQRGRGSYDVAGLYDRRSQSPCMELSRDFSRSPPDSPRRGRREESRTRDGPVIREESRESRRSRREGRDSHEYRGRERIREDRGGSIIREESREISIYREEVRERPKTREERLRDLVARERSLLQEEIRLETIIREQELGESSREGSRERRSGTVIREESRERRGGTAIREASRERRSGTVIREESRELETSLRGRERRSGTVIREESRELEHSPHGRDRRSSTFIREESRDGHRGRERRSGTVIREESRQGPFIREEFRERSMIREDYPGPPMIPGPAREGPGPVIREQSREGPVIREESRSAPIIREESREGIPVSRGKTGAVIIESRDRGPPLPRGRSPRGRSPRALSPRASSPRASPTRSLMRRDSSSSLDSDEIDPPSPPSEVKKSYTEDKPISSENAETSETNQPITASEVESRDRRSESRASRDSLSRQDSLRSCGSHTSSRTHCDVISTLSSSPSRDRSTECSMDKTLDSSLDNSLDTSDSGTDRSKLKDTDSKNSKSVLSSDDSPEKGSGLSKEALAIIRKTGRSRQKHQKQKSPHKDSKIKDKDAEPAQDIKDGTKDTASVPTKGVSVSKGAAAHQNPKPPCKDSKTKDKDIKDVPKNTISDTRKDIVVVVKNTVPPNTVVAKDSSQDSRVAKDTSVLKDKTGETKGASASKDAIASKIASEKKEISSTDKPGSKDRHRKHLGGSKHRTKSADSVENLTSVEKDTKNVKGSIEAEIKLQEEARVPLASSSNDNVEFKETTVTKNEGKSCAKPRDQTKPKRTKSKDSVGEINYEVGKESEKVRKDDIESKVKQLLKEVLVPVVSVPKHIAKSEEKSEKEELTSKSKSKDHTKRMDHSLSRRKSTENEKSKDSAKLEEKTGEISKPPKDPVKQAIDVGKCVGHGKSTEKERAKYKKETKEMAKPVIEEVVKITEPTGMEKEKPTDHSKESIESDKSILTDSSTEMSTSIEMNTSMEMSASMEIGTSTEMDTSMEMKETEKPKPKRKGTLKLHEYKKRKELERAKELEKLKEVENAKEESEEGEKITELETAKEDKSVEKDLPNEKSTDKIESKESQDRVGEGDTSMEKPKEVVCSKVKILAKVFGKSISKKEKSKEPMEILKTKSEEAVEAKSKESKPKSSTTSKSKELVKKSAITKEAKETSLQTSVSASAVAKMEESAIGATKQVEHVTKSKKAATEVVVSAKPLGEAPKLTSTADDVSKSKSKANEYSESKDSRRSRDSRSKSRDSRKASEQSRERSREGPRIREESRGISRGRTGAVIIETRDRSPIPRSRSPRGRSRSPRARDFSPPRGGRSPRASSPRGASLPRALMRRDSSSSIDSDEIEPPSPPREVRKSHADDQPISAENAGTNDSSKSASHSTAKDVREITESEEEGSKSKDTTTKRHDSRSKSKSKGSPMDYKHDVAKSSGSTADVQLKSKEMDTIRSKGLSSGTKSMDIVEEDTKSRNVSKEPSTSIEFEQNLERRTEQTVNKSGTSDSSKTSPKSRKRKRKSRSPGAARTRVKEEAQSPVTQSRYEGSERKEIRKTYVEISDIKSESMDTQSDGTIITEGAKRFEAESRGGKSETNLVESRNDSNLAQSDSLSLRTMDQSQCSVVSSLTGRSTTDDSLDMEVGDITHNAPPPSPSSGLRQLPKKFKSRRRLNSSERRKRRKLANLETIQEEQSKSTETDKPKTDDSVFKVPPSVDKLAGFHRKLQSRIPYGRSIEYHGMDSSGKLSPRSSTSAESGFVDTSGEEVADGTREMLKRKYWETEDTQRKRSRTESPRRRRSLSPPDGRARLNGDRSRSRFKNRDLIRAQSRSPSPDTEDDMFSLSPHPVKPDEPLIETDIEWIRCSPADLYYEKAPNGQLRATGRLRTLEDKFESDLVKRAESIRNQKPVYVPPPRKPNIHLHCTANCSGGQHKHTESSSDSDSESEEEESQPNWMEALERKISHPSALHNDLWFNDPGEMNDGPECRCSRKSRETGIRHSVYPGEEPLTSCQYECNNSDKLYHYRLTVSPTVNFLSKDPTVIEYDNHDYIFEGFSLFSHYKLENIPICKVIRFNIEYSIHFFKEIMPENFTIRSLDLVTDYIFSEILELYDLEWHGKDNKDGCRRFHIMPRFARDLPENGKELLSVSEIMKYLLDSSQPLVPDIHVLASMCDEEYQNVIEQVRGMIVTYPGMKPSSLRLDQLDRKPTQQDQPQYPLIVHFGVKPTKLSYAGNPSYQRAWKQYMKYKHLLANKPKVTAQDKEKLRRKEEELEEIRTKSSMKREVTVEVNAANFVKTGVRADICQHALLLPVLIAHLRFHRCVTEFEEKIDYRFNDRTLIQRALTHPSYRVNFGTNPDHARNSLSNCGIRQPEFGDRKIHHVNSRKKGINTLINIMSRMGHKHEKMSEIQHYEGLEFLGDAVVEFITSIHLFYMFPEAEEGGLATYRAAIVQNQHLAVMADRLRLQDYMLYAHGPDLCHESHLKHAMANCLEALMGALFLDSNIEIADRVFARTLFDEDEMYETWKDKPPHPLQADEPRGDRHWVKSSPALQKLVDLEEKLGLKFNHVRLLARAFTPRNVGYNSLTLGHNQRLEFLGDTVLQLIVSEYLFKHFPEHHEGHLSLLRSSLVNNRTQSIVADDLGMTEFIINMEKRDDSDLKMKEKADLLEAFIGSLYVDSGLDFCIVFCEVCFFPRLKRVILNQDWNDPKSQLQQCCLTLRELDGGEPFIPTYKMLESAGPTNTRTFKVAVYWQGERLATGVGQSIQRAEMNAAYNALTTRADCFPQLKHQKRFIEKKYRRYKLTETDIQLAGFKKDKRIGGIASKATENCASDSADQNYNYDESGYPINPQYSDQQQPQTANERWNSQRRGGGRGGGFPRGGFHPYQHHQHQTSSSASSYHHANASYTGRGGYSYFHRDKYQNYPAYNRGGGRGAYRGPYRGGFQARGGGAFVSNRGFRGGFQPRGGLRGGFLSRGEHYSRSLERETTENAIKVRKEIPRAYRSRSRSKSQSVERSIPDSGIHDDSSASMENGGNAQ